MQLTLQQAQVISNSPIFGKELPVQVAYKFSKLGKALMEELKLVEDQRMKMIQKYDGVLSEDKTQFSFTPENGEAFQKEMMELLTLPIEVPFQPLPVEKLGNVSLTPNELLALEPILAVAEAE